MTLRDLELLYAKANFVISAACATHSDAGFSAPRNLPYREYELPLNLIDGENTTRDSISLVERAFERTREPIDERAWTDREDKNALYLIRFESEQVSLRCRETSAADSDIGWISFSDKFAATTSSLDGSIFPSMLPQTPPDCLETHLLEWLLKVADFSTRCAKYLDDKLIAFGSSAKNWASATGWDPSQYKAGLWIKDMPRQLLWSRDCRSKKNFPVDASASTTSTPSWSWASILSPVTWRDQNDLLLGKHTLEIVECKIKLKFSNPFQGVEGGQLINEGYIREAFWNGREMIEDTSSSDAGRTFRGASKIHARARTLSPSKPHTVGNRCRQSRSPIGPDRQVLSRRPPEAEFAVIPIEVVWDTPEQLAPQKVKCLEIREGVSRDSYGIVLSNNGSNTSKRLGYFRFEHPTRKIRGKDMSEEIRINWLRQKVCVV